MRFREILTEAVYDNVAVALKRAFPHRVSMIDDELTWAKSALKRPDRINWYMLLVKNILNGNLNKVMGGYRFQTLDQLHNDLTHFYGYNVPAIERYVYNQQTIGEVLSALDRELKKYQESEKNKPKPVTPQTGDHVLFDFQNGIQWWFVDRGYCPDEGRSGNHCGNIEGQRKKDQRLLSLRKNGNVLLTFVLEPNGELGEMKAWGNQKPADRYHPYIAKLLMWDRITGITGQGYMPGANFSMFDLSANDLAFFDQNKPQLIRDQCQITPTEILQAPASIQKKYQQYIASQAIRQLIDDPRSLVGWDNAIKQDPMLILFAPHDLPNFEKKLLQRAEWMAEVDEQCLFTAPDSIARNPDLLNKILAVSPDLLAGVNQSVPGYRDLCMTAVKTQGSALQFVPLALRDREMCLTAMNNHGALELVPKALRDREMCLTAVADCGWCLDDVPLALRDREMYLAAVKDWGLSLRLVPAELRDRDMCLPAVVQDSRAIEYVPVELRPEIRRLSYEITGDPG